jgi:hypothetical protein
MTFSLIVTATMSFTLPLTTMNLHAFSHLSDEKWFYGLVARTFAKACESLGIKKQSFSCQHKSPRSWDMVLWAIALTLILTLVVPGIS